MSVRVIVLKNSSDHGEGRMMIVPDAIEDFLRTAGEKLSISKPAKAYTENGGRIDDLSILREDEKIFISSGEPFFKYDNSRVKTYKIALLGSGGVGKSCLSLRYVKSTFVDVYDPTIEDAFRHQVSVLGQTCILDILDTAGQEDMQILRRQWIEDREGFIFVFSLIDKTTIDDLNNYWELLNQVREENPSKKEPPIVLCGNKKDLEGHRKVTYQEGLALALKFKGEYVEASAKTGENVSTVFEELVKLFIRMEPENPAESKKKKSNCILL